jgi:hypothetical protein
MNTEHPISSEVLNLVNMAIIRGEHWMAYNNSLYFIDKNEVHFFKDKFSANEFATSNISDKDSFCVMHFNSVKDIFKEIPYSGKLAGEPVCDPDANGLHNRDGNEFTDALIEHIEQQQFSLFNSQLKINIMNNENLQYLTDSIKYMGFGENLKIELEKNMNDGKADFQLQYHAEINRKPFEAVLNFRKSDSTDMYFFNSYHASLEKNNGEKVDQTFYLNKGKGVTAKEAFNLLEGRSVYKELNNKAGEPYKAWIQLDFDNKDKNNNNEVKQYHENYGYDLKAAVSKFAISELNDVEKEKALMQSLQKGNMQSVTVEQDGSVNKMFIEANPQYKTANLYDGQMKRVQKEDIGNFQTVVSTTQTSIKEGQVVKPENKQEKPRKNMAHDDNGLLPKKRERQKKGLKIS